MPDTTVIDALMRGNQREVAVSDAEIGRLVGPLGGRYSDVPLQRFTHDDYDRRTPDCLTLRIDGKDGRGEISGDIFRPGVTMQKGRAIGERRDWALSFYGRLAAYVPEDDGARFFALCEAAVAGQSPGGPRSGVVFELLLDASGTRIAEAKVSQVLEDAVSFSYSQQWRAAEVGVSEPAYRRVQVRYAVTKGAAHYSQDIAPLLDENDPYYLGAGLAGAGIAARFDEVSLLGNPFNRGGTVFDLYPNPLVRHALAHSIGSKCTQVDWQVFLLFAAVGSRRSRPFSMLDDVDETKEVDDSDTEGVRRAQNAALGYTLGMAESASRFRSRFGAVVNMAGLGAIGNWSPGHIEEDRKVAYLARQTALHELGHVFNLPHPWNREDAHPLLGGSDPATGSVLNYPTRHPHGWAAPAVLGRQGDWAKPIFQGQSKYGEDTPKSGVLAARMREFENSHRYGQFDAAERRFLRHAPFDQVAEGGRSFKDARRSAPRFGPQRRVADMQLQLVARKDGGAFDADDFYMPGEAFQWHTWSAGISELPPLPLWVRVVDRENKPVHIGSVSFGMGLLQLLVMEDVPAAEVRQGRLPRVAAIDPGAQPGRNAHGARVHGYDEAPLVPSENKEAFHALYEPVFWVSHEMLSASLGELSLREMKRFWLQVQYFDGDAQLCSNPVLVDVSTYKTFPGGKTALKRAKGSGDVSALRRLPNG